MRQLIFFNNFHNGDLHYSREFVKDIISKTNYDDYTYLNNYNLPILKDIRNLKYGKIMNLDPNQQIIVDSDKTYVNTWIGQVSAKYLTKDCTIYSNYDMYCDIFKRLDINIENLEYYVPTIDFNNLDCRNIDSLNNNKKILICNGDVMSGQCPNFSFDNMIQRLSETFQNIDFILTCKNQLNKNNILFTSDIINILGTDLNEISYLSTKCDIIIGRASGPHAFTHIKDNYFNKNKTYISFTSKRSEGTWFEEGLCNQVWSNDFDENSIYNIIYNEIKKL